MPIPFSRIIKPVAQSINIEKELKDNRSDWITWWYCGFYKNKRAESQPNILVEFREFAGNEISEVPIRRLLPLTSLGQVRIGSIWKDGISKFMADFPVEDFDIDFRPGEWCHTSFENAYRNGASQPFPMNVYPLHFKTDKNWLLEFKLPSGGKLIVPSLEFFSRCYGRSQELNRVLATYPWKGFRDAHNSRLYAPQDEPEETNRWKVKLRRRLKNGDTTFLAHAKYDAYSENVAKSIYAQLEKSYTPENKAPMFIKIPPWFQGPAEIRARGIWFDNNRSFLALQIMGCSDPDGILILRDRENTNKTDGIDPENGDVAWAGAPVKIFVRPPDIVDLTKDDEPDHGADAVEILDTDFVVMGIPRMIVDIYGKKITSKSGKKGSADCSSTYSSGDQFGSNTKVGYASISAKPIIETNGVLIDMWKAMLHTQCKHSEKIRSVEWFTFEDNYVSSGQPNLIGLNAFDEEDELEVPTITRNWLYQDVANAKVRGVMIVRMIVNGAAIYIIELQRRPRTKKDTNDKKKDSEESFQGFVIMFKDVNEFLPWLRRFLSDVRYVRGIVKKLVPFSQGKADTFTHKPAANEEIPCEAAVLNALFKMGIQL